MTLEGNNILRIEGLKTHFFTSEGVVKAVDGVDLTLDKGRTLGIVGESGCGKTVLSLSLLRLIPDPPGKIVSGKIIFDGVDLTALAVKELVKIRGSRISMIFQEPMTSLNPVFTIGSQISEVFRVHQKLSQKDSTDKAIEMLRLVGLPMPEKRINDYPHQMSGGMCQRVMIAIAMACRPQLMIADEPTTALDVTTQAQILDMMEKLKAETKSSIIFVTHDLGIVYETCQDVAVMYTGKVVEKAGTKDLFSNPLHPYTKGLIKSVPKQGDSRKGNRLNVIRGYVPNFKNIPAGCSFSNRCDEVFEVCSQEPPETMVSGRMVKCWRYSS